MKYNHIDRILGVLCALLVLRNAYMVLSEFSVSWSWVLLLVWTTGLGLWTWKGLRKIEVGWRAQLLLIGQRMSVTLGEGWRWVPFPFGIKVADCRQTVIKLDLLKVITEDNVQVEIDGTLIREIKDLDKFFGVEESGIKQGLDDIWDQIIRTSVREKKLDEVLKMHVKLGEKVFSAMGEKASENWGITILRVVIAGIEPDPRVVEDLALKEREKLQREGQIIELQHFTNRVTELMASPPTGAGLSREQAIEQVQMSLGKATKNIDAKTITLDPSTAAIITAILGRR